MQLRGELPPGTFLIPIDTLTHVEEGYIMNSDLREKIDWKDVQEYARAVRQGRIPQEILDESEITYRQPWLFGTWKIPLPKDLRLKEALEKAAPRLRFLARRRSAATKS